MDKMDIVQLIGQVGFPIAVAAWLLVKFESTLEKVEISNRDLESKVEILIAVCTKFHVESDK